MAGGPSLTTNTFVTSAFTASPGLDFQALEVVRGRAPMGAHSSKGGCRGLKKDKKATGMSALSVPRVL